MKVVLPSEALIRPDVVNLSLRATTAPAAIRELHAGLGQVDGVIDAPGLLRDLLEREALGANCLDGQVALPHARTMSVNRFVLAIGRSETGVYFAEGHPSIRLVLLVGAPLDAVNEYLRWTAHLVRTLRDPAVRHGLLTASASEAVSAVWSASARAVC